MSLRWLLTALALSLALAAFHLCALTYDLFYYHWWLDVPMHILGGITIGAFFVGVTGRFHPILFIFFVLWVSMGWEVIEYFFGTTFTKTDYFFDTAHDLLDDALGALLVYVVARKTIWR